MPRGADRWPLALAAALAVPVAIGIVGEFRSPLNGDAAYQLDAARRMLGGAGLYRDLIDLNPPFVFWLSMLPSALGLDGAGTIAAFRAGVIALAAASFVLAWPALRGRPVLWAGFVLMALALPLGYFGEREHLLFIMVFPLVAFDAVRIEGYEPGRGRAVLAGALAALGILLKPPAVLLVLALGAYRVSRERTLRGLVRPDFVALMAGGLAGVIAVFLLAPQYLGIVREYGPMYAQFARQTVGQLLFRDVHMWAVWAAAAAVIVAGVSQPWLGRGRVLLGASLAMFAAAVAQGKGFGYHYYPALAFAVLTLLEVAASPETAAGGRRLAARVIAAAALVPVLWMLGDVAWARAAGRPTRLAGEQRHVAALIGGEPGGSGVAIVSARIADTYPVVLRNDYRFVLSFPHAWFATLAPGTPGADALRRRYARDLDGAQPGVLVVRAPESPGPGDAAIDYVAWLCADPAVRRALGPYSLTNRVEGFDLYRRSTAGAGACASS